MAYKDSSEIATDQNYVLGEYNFRIEESSVPGSTNNKIEAICTQGGKSARMSIQLPSTTKLNSWFVEANGDTATVYAIVAVPTGEGGEATSDLDTNWPQPIPVYGSASCEYNIGTGDITEVATGNLLISKNDTMRFSARFVGADRDSLGQVARVNQKTGETTVTDIAHSGLAIFSVTRKGLTAYYVTYSTNTFRQRNPSPYVAERATADANTIWTAVFGRIPTEYETKEVLIGRFKIDLKDAGGVGPGSDWVDPGDYDPDWEPDDPTHTLYVTVTGALSGRHNDPIVDPSYSYIPADKDTVKDYGCGGDGGHGGGGGAGASTVVIHKFATNQANSKEVTAIARRHGYGSGGGKGGKGGDGCILVYY